MQIYRVPYAIIETMGFRATSSPGYQRRLSREHCHEGRFPTVTGSGTRKGDDPYGVLYHMDYTTVRGPTKFPVSKG